MEAAEPDIDKEALHIGPARWRAKQVGAVIDDDESPESPSVTEEDVTSTAIAQVEVAAKASMRKFAAGMLQNQFERERQSVGIKAAVETALGNERRESSQIMARMVAEASAENQQRQQALEAEHQRGMQRLELALKRVLREKAVLQSQLEEAKSAKEPGGGGDSSGVPQAAGEVTRLRAKVASLQTELTAQAARQEQEQAKLVAGCHQRVKIAALQKEQVGRGKRRWGSEAGERG